VPVQNFTEFNAHGHESIFVPLADNPQREIVKLNTFASEAQKLADPKPGINRCKSKGAKATVTDADGPPVQYSFDLLHCESRQYLVLLFEPTQFGPLFQNLLFVRPVQKRLEAPEVGVNRNSPVASAFSLKLPDSLDDGRF